MNSTIEKLKQLNEGTMMEQLQIEYLETSDTYIKARMPVDKRTFQPDGILHGGASLALAETVAGLGSALLVDLKLFDVRGAQVSANHVGTARSGWVIAEAKLIHKGKNTHIWDVNIRTEKDKPVSICRITNFVMKKSPD